MLRYLACTLSIIAACTVSAWGQASVEKYLPVSGTIEEDGSAIHLNWVGAKPPRVGNVIVKRRLLGDSGAGSWKVIAPELGPVLRFSDEAVSAGFAYEYQVLRTARDIVDVGYWTSGVELPAVETRGKVLVIVDETVASLLAPRLARFERDLRGDGWQVIRHNAPRGNPGNAISNFNRALATKDWIRAQYDADPFAKYAMVLIGHIPIVMSGRSAPDGHDRVPHATDLFYADMNEGWPVDDKGLVRTNRVPSERIEIEVGRIDFSNVSAGDKAKEHTLLRAYFDKNHHWRQGLLGDQRQAYAQNGNLIIELLGLRNIVGKRYVVKGGHHDVGEEKPWLWGVDFGDWEGKVYAKKYANKAVFVINFGSGKQKIELRSNALTGSLAQPWYTIAAGWGGRPAWWLHHMALGRTIGESHMRTVNNGTASEPYRESMDYYPTGNYLWRNPVWVNLLGDPTTHAFVLSPPTQVSVQTSESGASLSWTASIDTDVIGYKIYRAEGPNGLFKPLEGAESLETTSFEDTSPAPDATYMIRAYGLKKVHAGSFYTYSQGAFGTLGNTPVMAEDRVITTPRDTQVALGVPVAASENGRIFSLIEGPKTGKVSSTEDGWLYTPVEGATGDVTLRYSVSDGFSTDTGQLSVRIGD